MVTRSRDNLKQHDPCKEKKRTRNQGWPSDFSNLDCRPSPPLFTFFPLSYMSFCNSLPQHSQLLSPFLLVTFKNPFLYHSPTKPEKTNPCPLLLFFLLFFPYTICQPKKDQLPKANLFLPFLRLFIAKFGVNRLPVAAWALLGSNMGVHAGVG